MHPSPAHLECIGVELGNRRYDIVIGSGLLDDVLVYSDLPESNLAAVITNTTVAPLYAERLQRVLALRHKRVLVLTLPDGEAHKDWSSLNSIFDALLGARADRRTVVYALGGGVVGDLAGFAAACYMRGVPFVQIPTTLLAQVDSSVGGKTAINHLLGKNMIGAFYQPMRVVVDLATLDTLPEREMAAGLAEIIKYGPIADSHFFDWIEANLQPLIARDKTALTYAVRRSCEIKAHIVARDEREDGVRAILNFGHTLGHAIETGLGYGKWLHGEAVGCGMVMATELSVRLNLIDEGYARRIRRIIERAGLPTVAPPLGEGRYLELMHGDKKAEGDRIRFVVLEKPGRAVVRSVPDSLVRELITSSTSQPTT